MTLPEVTKLCQIKDEEWIKAAFQEAKKVKNYPVQGQVLLQLFQEVVTPPYRHIESFVRDNLTRSIVLEEQPKKLFLSCFKRFFFPTNFLQEALEALRCGAEKILEKMLKEGLDPNTKDICGMSLAAHAIDHGRPSALALLLKYGADPSTRDAYGESLLERALIKNDRHCIEILIKSHVDLNQQDIFGNSILLWAVRSQDIRIVEWLLEYGADPNLRRNEASQNSILAEAVENGNLELIRLLLAYGARIAVRADEVPIEFTAIRAGHFEVLKYLLGCCGNIHATYHGKTLLDVADQENDAEAISFLFERDAILGSNQDIHSELLHNKIIEKIHHELCQLPQQRKVHCCGHSLVELAYRTHNRELFHETVKHFHLSREDIVRHREFFKAVVGPYLESLISQRLLPCTTKMLGQSLMLFAARIGHLSLLKTLINAGINANEADEDGVTPLHEACLQGRLDIAKLLVEHGHANISTKDKFKMPCLYWAVRSHNADLVRYLMSFNRYSGLDLTQKNTFGVSVIDEMMSSDPEVADLLSTYSKYDSNKLQKFQEILMKKMAEEAVKLSKTAAEAAYSPIQLSIGVSGGYIIRHCIPRAVSVVARGSYGDVFTQSIAIYKPETQSVWQESLSPGSGALRQRLAFLLSSYLTKKAKTIPHLPIQGFSVPIVSIVALDLPLREEKSDLGHNPNVRSDIGALIKMAHNSEDSADLDASERDRIPGDEWIKLLILDMLLGNTDRHPNNFRVRRRDLGDVSHYSIIPIDHDLTFPNASAVERGSFRWEYSCSAFKEPLPDAWRRFIVSLNGEEMWAMINEEIQKNKVLYPGMICDIGFSNQLLFLVSLEILKQSVANGDTMDEIAHKFLSKTNSAAYRILHNLEALGSQITQKDIQHHVELVLTAPKRK